MRIEPTPNTHTNFTFTGAPPLAETTHKIYERLLTYLANPQIRVNDTGRILPSILHPQTKAALLSEHEFIAGEVAKLESDIFSDVEFMPEYEVIRDVPAALYHALKQQGAEDLVVDEKIVPLPASVLNALICELLQKEFTRADLLSTPGFIEIPGRDDDGFLFKKIRLDIDENICRRGFLMPVHRDGLITCLRVFRHPKDEFPFRLKSRSEVQYDS